VSCIERVSKELHEMNGAGMKKHEAAEIAARLAEMEQKVARLEELARQAGALRAATTSSASR
jgi:tRNA A58 N-methylase Trm61